jgi:cytochrome c-type biogenesis protein CcmH
MKIARALIAVLLLAILPARAVEPGEMIADPAMEARAREISEHLRCVVCQNQTIDDSNAPLAHDMRLLVRERLLAGDSNEEAIAYIVARYGNFVLLRPPFQPDTWALWIAPFVVLGLALGGLFMQMQRRAAPAPVPLSEQEQALLRQKLARSKNRDDT